MVCNQHPWRCYQINRRKCGVNCRKKDWLGEFPKLGFPHLWIHPANSDKSVSKHQNVRKITKKTVWNMISPHLRPKKHWKHETLTESVFSWSPSFVFARLQTWPSSPANSMNDRYHHFLSHDSSGIRMEITKKLKDFSNEKKGLCFLATRTRS